MNDLKGKVWVFGDHVDTDQIIPAEYLLANNLDHLDDFIFEKTRPGLSSKIVNGDIIVAGRNFGCGSSREHAPLALKESGISCIVAQSFGRIFYRNSINIGLPVLECTVDVSEGDTISIDLKNGTIINESTKKEYVFQKMPDFLMSIIDAGGLINKLKEDI